MDGSLGYQGDIDFGSVAGLQRLLQIVRGTPMNRSDYNHLRDLIFAYKQQGDSPTIKTEILNLLSEVGIEANVMESAHAPASIPELEAVTAEPVAEPAPTPEPAVATTQSVSRPRPRPQFAPTAVATTPAPALTPVSEPVVEPVTEPATTPEPVPAPEPVAAPEPVVAPEVVPVSAEPEPVAEPVATTEPVAVPVTPTSEDPLTRIKEIKHAVNEKIGNPVNLIDANNEVGREYMNALLEAMKHVNGGTPEEVAAAMQRLEASFSTVQTMLDGGAVPTASAAAPAPEPVTEPTPAPELVQTPEPVATPEPAVAPVVETTPTPAVVEKTAAIPDSVDPTPTTESVPAVEPVAQVAPAGSMPLQSVAKEKQLQDLMRNTTAEHAQAKQAEEAAKLAEMDPLMVPAVTEGLQQLLAEWKLFKSSGIFGTGPSGHEHPLYVQLAGLPMSALIAGRFEDATPEVKQSIADYMNGWRYEEGVVHELTETFEHYLRRVIAGILAKNAQSKEAKGGAEAA